jgi:hypothetical protein
MIKRTDARFGSFAKAAAELHKVPSALSYTVNQLERELDTSPFSADGGRVSESSGRRPDVQFNAFGSPWSAVRK